MGRASESQSFSFAIPSFPAAATSTHCPKATANARDDPRHVRSVPMIILRIARVLGLIVDHAAPVHVVHESVAVVVNAVAGDFLAVHPHVGGQIGMGVVHPGVNHGNADVAVATGRQALGGG